MSTYYYKLSNGTDEVYCTASEHIKEDDLPEVMCLPEFTAKEINKEEYDQEADLE